VARKARKAPPLRLEGTQTAEEARASAFARPEEPLQWRIHDRTHLELNVPYSLESLGEGSFGWEAYFFVPQSFRVDKRAYSQAEIYADLVSYLRLSAPPATLSQLVEELDGAFDAQSPHALRVLACRIRRRAYEEQRSLLELASAFAKPSGEPTGSEHALRVEAFVREARALTSRLHRLAMTAGSGESDADIAIRWVDEDASILVEAVSARVASALEEGASRECLVSLAVEEAAHRRDAGYDAVIGTKTPRAIERLEFRRHTLKRFAAGALWLDAQVESPGNWARHALFGLAAAVAMAFAVAAALYNGVTPDSRDITAWLLIAVVAYAIKDRVKAALQEIFAGVLSKYFPDRRWLLRARSTGAVVAQVDERSAFMPFDRVPEAPLSLRRSTRRHALEEEARPETVFWHKKEVIVDREALDQSERGVDGLLEIFRLDLRRWLAHTDDAKNSIILAGPDGTVQKLRAPRVYNIAVVYRSLHPSDPDPPWHRVRVVVCRKGIKRIEPIC
jgi:hypothetical protein